jgi:hypothetical protein
MRSKIPPVLENYLELCALPSVWVFFYFCSSPIGWDIFCEKSHFYRLNNTSVKFEGPTGILNRPQKKIPTCTSNYRLTFTVCQFIQGWTWLENKLTENQWKIAETIYTLDPRKFRTVFISTSYMTDTVKVSRYLHFIFIIEVQNYGK